MPYFFLSSLKGYFLGGFFLGRPHNMGYQALAFKMRPTRENGSAFLPLQPRLPARADRFSDRRAGLGGPGARRAAGGLALGCGGAGLRPGGPGAARRGRSHLEADH
jgi:hypothetical protein